MPTLRVPPGRAGRLWLRHRLATAVRGADLLETKLRILQDRLRDAQDRADTVRRHWQEVVAAAETWLLRADLTGGASSLDAATGGLAQVTVTWATSMGVHHPLDAICEIQPVPVSSATPASAALVETRAAYQQAAVAAVRHAAATAAVAQLSAEVSATRQRVRALRRRWIPLLQEGLARVEFELEELERDEAVRRLRSRGDHSRSH